MLKNLPGAPTGIHVRPLDEPIKITELDKDIPRRQLTSEFTTWFLDFVQGGAVQYIDTLGGELRMIGPNKDGEIINMSLDRLKRNIDRCTRFLIISTPACDQVEHTTIETRSRYLKCIVDITYQLQVLEYIKINEDHHLEELPYLGIITQTRREIEQQGRATPISRHTAAAAFLIEPYSRAEKQGFHTLVTRNGWIILSDELTLLETLRLVRAKEPLIEDLVDKPVREGRITRAIAMRSFRNAKRDYQDCFQRIREYYRLKDSYEEGLSFLKGDWKNIMQKSTKGQLLTYLSNWKNHILRFLAHDAKIKLLSRDDFKRLLEVIAFRIKECAEAIEKEYK